MSIDFTPDATATIDFKPDAASVDFKPDSSPMSDTLKSTATALKDSVSSAGKFLKGDWAEKVVPTATDVGDAVKQVAKSVPQVAGMVHSASPVPVTPNDLQHPIDKMQQSVETAGKGVTAIATSVPAFISGMTMGAVDPLLDDKTKIGHLMGQIYPPAMILQAMEPQNVPPAFMPSPDKTKFFNTVAGIAGNFVAFDAVGEMSEMVPGLAKSAEVMKEGAKAESVIKTVAREATAGGILGMLQEGAKGKDPISKDALETAVMFAGVSLAGRAASTLNNQLKITDKIYDMLPDNIKAFFFYRGAQPQVYAKLAEERQRISYVFANKMADIGESMQGLTHGEQLRVGQLLANNLGIGTASDKIMKVALPAKEVLDQLEKESIERGWVDPAHFGKMTRGDRAILRKKIDLIQQRIDSLRTVGNFRQKEGILDAVSKISLKGVASVDRQVDRAGEAISNLEKMVPDVKEILTGEQFKDIEEILQDDSIRRNKGVEKILTRFQKSSIGDQEKLFNRIEKVAKKAGAKIEDIDTSKITIGGLKGLLGKLESVKGNFPGKQGLINALEMSQRDMQNRLVDNYRMSGKSYFPRLFKVFEEPKKYDIPNAMLPVIAEMSDGQLKALADLNPKLASKVGDYINKNFKTRPSFGPSASVKVSGNAFKKRIEFLPEMYRAALGEIHEPAYPFVKRTNEIKKDLLNAKFFDDIAGHPEWTSKNPVPGFKQMPDAPKKYGPLSGKYLPGPVKDDIVGMMNIPQEWEQKYKKALSMWKFSKTGMNPATWFNMAAFHTIANDMTGFNTMRQVPYLFKAFKGMSEESPLFKEFRDMGGGMGNVSGMGTEISKFLKPSMESNKDGMSLAIDIGKQSLDKMGHGYEASANLWRFSRYMWNVDHGMSPTEAVESVRKSLFDYEHVSPFVKDLRTIPTGVPFVTFTSNLIPGLGRAMLESPTSVMKYHYFFDAISNEAARSLNLTEQQYHLIKSNPYGNQVLTPFKDDKGNPYTIDASKYLPYGDVAGGDTLMSHIEPGGPLLPLAEGIFNKSLFKSHFGDQTGQIYLSHDPMQIKLTKAMDYIIQSELPSLAGGFGSRRIMASLEKEPRSSSGEPEPLGLAVLASAFGLKFTPEDTKILERYRSLDYEQTTKQLKGSIMRILSDTRLNPTEKQDKTNLYLQEYRKQTQQFFDDMGIHEKVEGQ